MLQTLKPYNNSLNELESTMEKVIEEIYELEKYKAKLRQQNKPYVFIDIRINKQNYLLDCIETFIEKSNQLIAEINQLHQLKNANKNLDQTNHNNQPQRLRICDLPQNRDYEIIEMLNEILNKLEEKK